MAGLDAFGTQLQRSDMGAVPVFTPIANVTGFKGPKIKRDTSDVTAHDSATRWREFIGTLVDAGEISLDLNYDPTFHNSLVGDFQDTVARNYRLVYPGGSSTWSFSAFMVGFETEAPVDDKLSATVGFKITGKPAIV